jgi:hypothetical protein
VLESEHLRNVGPDEFRLAGVASNVEVIQIRREVRQLLDVCALVRVVGGCSSVLGSGQEFEGSCGWLVVRLRGSRRC